MAMKNKQKHIPLQKTIWCKIRYWQLLHDWTDDELAMYLNCSTRTTFSGCTSGRKCR